MAACAYGLYYLRRWGVILFGLLVSLGSINHIVRTLMSYASLSTMNLVGVMGALISILVAILIPSSLIYLTLLLWRQVR